MEEKIFTVLENLSLVPLTVTISDYRDYASKVLFYSRTRDLQMYYAVGDATYPEKLFKCYVSLHKSKYGKTKIP